MIYRGGILGCIGYISRNVNRWYHCGILGVITEWIGDTMMEYWVLSLSLNRWYRGGILECMGYISWNVNRWYHGGILGDITEWIGDMAYTGWCGIYQWVGVNIIMRSYWNAWNTLWIHDIMGRYWDVWDTLWIGDIMERYWNVWYTS